MRSLSTKAGGASDQSAATILCPHSPRAGATFQQDVTVERGADSHGHGPDRLAPAAYHSANHHGKRLRGDGHVCTCFTPQAQSVNSAQSLPSQLVSLAD